MSRFSLMSSPGRVEINFKLEKKNEDILHSLLRKAERWRGHCAHCRRGNRCSEKPWDHCIMQLSQDTDDIQTQQSMLPSIGALPVSQPTLESLGPLLSLLPWAPVPCTTLPAPQRWHGFPGHTGPSPRAPSRGPTRRHYQHH